jgi:MFS family permease
MVAQNLWRQCSLKMSLLADYIHGFGRFQRNARLYLISFALSGVSVGIILVLYNLYLVSLGYNTDFVGFVLFAGYLGAALAIFPAGICTDRFGGKLILIWSSAAIGIAAAGQILFRQPIPLLISGFLAGVAGAFVLVVNAPFLTNNSTPGERPLLFSFNIVVSLATTVLGELLGGVLPLWLRANNWLMASLPSWISWLLANQAQPRSYQLAFLLAGLLAVPSFLPLFLMSDDRPDRIATRERDNASIAQQSRVSLMEQLRTFIARMRYLHWRKVLLSPISVLVVVQVLIGLGAGMLIPYFNLYFVQHLGATSALFGLIDGSANAINALLTLLAPLLALRIGKINTIAATQLLGVGFLLIIGLSGWLPLSATVYPFRQGATDMAMGVFQVFAMEAAPQRRRGLANSLYQSSAQVSRGLTTPLGGLLIARSGYTPVFITTATLYILAILLLWGAFRHYEGTKGDMMKRALKG